MTQEEIHRLLGGYATNTLTEGERAALFEAALEDQTLFDALHNEDALREVLADPITREQVQEVLRPARRVWWMRRPWVIGMAGVGAAAVVAVAIVMSQRKPVRQAPAIEIASTQIAQKPVEPALIVPKPVAPRSVKRAAAIPAPAQTDALRNEAPSPQLSASPAAGAIVGAIGGTGSAANAPLYNGPLVRYSLLRSGPSGDAVRIEVVSQVAGYLTLYHTNAAGQWQRVYPVNAPQIAIAANTTYQIPDDPIASRGTQDKLRLVINPGMPTTTGQLGEPRAKALVDKGVEKAAAPAPLVVEIGIGAN